MDQPVNGELIPQGGGDNIPLTRTPLVIGRRESCDITLDFANISGRHCELTFKESFWIIHDLDSRNGVKINGMRIDQGGKKILHNGDLISIAKRVYQLQYQETGRITDLAEFEEELEDMFNIPLLEKANLIHPPKHARPTKADVAHPALDE